MGVIDVDFNLLVRKDDGDTFTVKGKVKYMDVCALATFLDGKPAIKELNVKDLSGLDIDVDGLGFLGNLVNLFSDALIGLFHGSIKDAIGNELKSTISDVMKNFKLEDLGIGSFRYTINN